jgi:hypothetical protein
MPRQGELVDFVQVSSWDTPLYLSNRPAEARNACKTDHLVQQLCLSRQPEASRIMCKAFKSAVRLLLPVSWFCALGTLPPSRLDAQDIKVDVVTPPDASFDIDAPFSFQVLARGAPVVLEGAVFAVVDDSTAKSLNSAFSLASATKVGTQIPTTIPVTVDKKALENTVSAKGALFLQYHAETSNKADTGQRWTFLLIRAAPDVTVVSHPITITRQVPFTTLLMAPGQTNACLSYQATPTPLREGTTVPGEVFTAGTDASRIAGLTIQGKVSAGDQMCLNTSIPGQYTELKGRLWLRPPKVKKAADVDLDLRVKDAWGWRAAATLVATAFALGFIYWTTTVRRRLLNGAQRGEVSNRLAQFLAANPTLANHDSVGFVRQLILDSNVDDREGEFDLSAQSLASASSRLDMLVAAPPAAPAAVAASSQAIRVVNSPQRLLTGEKIIFLIGKPNTNWPAVGGLYRWTVASSGKPIASEQGVDVQRFAHIFESIGAFQVQVNVDGANPETRDLTILQRPSPGMVEKFRIAAVAVVLMTLLIAAGTAFMATQDALTFGTIGDYLKLLATAFGVSGSAGGAATIFTAIRGR